MTARSVIVGTAGHIDHGKTRLVRALTGVDTDRLPEEKRRGITIDLGFASCELPAPDGSSLDLSFVDVPGHKLFIRNMLAGAGGIDCVLLVVAADDGVMPQTEEHLAICTLLGIRRGLVALCKADLVPPERLGEARAEVASLVRGSFLERAPVLAVSAATGTGVPELRKALAQLAAEAPIRGAEGLLRLPLDRAFTMKGFGTVVTGTLQSGTLRRGQALRIEPGGLPVRARGLQTHNRAVEQAIAGSRVAVNLAGVEVADAPRGATLVDSPALFAVDTLDVEVELLPDAPELKRRARVRFHCFTAETMASVSLYGAKTLLPGGRGLARLRLAQPVVLAPGDRFVLRRPSPARTVGGGRVLDAHPLPLARKKEVQPWLATLAEASASEQARLRIDRRGASGLDIRALCAETGWTERAARAAIAPVLGGLVRLLGSDLFIAADHLVEAARRLHTCWKQLAAKLPAGGVRRSDLHGQSGLEPRVFSAALALVAELRVEGPRGAELVLLSGASAQAQAADQRQLDAVADAYRRAGLQAPLPAEVARTLGISQADMKRLLTTLLRAKVLERLGADDLLVHSEALGQLEGKVRALRGQLLDVSRFKQITGLSRKYAIPLLEHLDRAQVTRKQGEARLVL